MNTKIGWPLVFGLVACVAPPVRGGVPSETAPDYFPRVAMPVEGVPLDVHSDLHVVINGPQNASYDITTFGPSERTVSIRLSNQSDHRVDVAGVDAMFSATRDGVSFPCPARARKVKPKHEPFLLPSGEDFTFERDLDCTMPLPGRYNVRVYITFDEPSARAVADFADEFNFDVAPTPQSPRTYPSRPGLYVAMNGDVVTRPLSSEAWARGDYHVVVAVINASDQPVAAGPARLAFLTYKGSSTLPCSGQAEPLNFPTQLAPGRMVTMTAPVACAPSAEGIYEIVGRFAFADRGNEIEIGRIDLTVTRDPLFFTPGLRLWSTELPQ